MTSTRSDRSRSADLTGVVAVLGASGATIASFLPWGRSGQTSRTSYELVGLAGRLEVLPGTTARLASLWFLVPVLAGSAWLALSVRRARLAATLAASVGLLSLVGAEMTVRSPLAAELGVAVARGAGAVAVTAAVVHLVMHRS